MSEGELRERLAYAYYGLRWLDAHSWGWIAPEHKAGYYEVVDAMLAEITAAGYVLVPADRYERLVSALSQIDTAVSAGGYEGVGKWGVLPGDLEPVEEAERLDDGGEA